MREVFVCSEKRQIVPDGKLRKQCINSADLNACLTTCISQGRSTDVIISIGLKQRQGGKAFDDLSLGFGAQEPLQQLLKNHACSDHDVCAEQGVFQFLHLGFGCFNIPAKGQRPNTCINEQRHLRRDRSAL